MKLPFVMRRLFVPLLLLVIEFSCKDEGKAPEKYADFFRENLKGNISSVQDSIFVVDSSGNLKPDSVSYSLQQFENGVAAHFTEIDQSGKNKTSSDYSFYANGLLKGINKEANGKTIYRLDVQLDPSGKYNTAQSYDSSGRLDYYNTGLSQDERGHLTGGKLFKSDSSLIMSFSAKFNGNHLISRTNYDPAGMPASRSSYLYNEKGDEIVDSTIRMTKDSTKVTLKKFSYDEYDSMGNWTRKTELSALTGDPVKVTRRKINYRTSN